MKGLFHSAAGLALLAISQSLLAAPGGGQIVSLSVSNAQARVGFASSSGNSYQVQSSGVIGSRFWADALAPITADGNLTTAAISAPASSGFFRVLEFTNRVFWYDWRYYYESPLLLTWGLGTPQSDYAHLDRAYEWYIDQADTGAYANNNCGPSSVTMAIKWYNAGFTRTAADARNTYPEGGGWWYTTDILNYLNLYSVPNTTSSFTGTNQLVAVLNQGNLAILCLDTTYLGTDFTTEHRVGRFYGYAGGHFLVVKGWRATGDRLSFEVYDPNNWHALYADGTPKGRNRHYIGGDLASAIANWWNYLIVVHPSSGGGALTSSWLVPVDPARIPRMPGR